ncbi:MAG: hypothetical protein KTR14_11410 [Vampirovibrio sp.]|nr:hypothetical protein [Vampirovibrio sp.]
MEVSQHVIKKAGVFLLATTLPAFILTGCGGETSDSSAEPLSKTSQGHSAKKAKQQKEGVLMFAMASELAVPGKNPFLNKLPVPQQDIQLPNLPQIEANNNTPDTNESDPLNSINLIGVVFQDKKPMALISSTQGNLIISADQTLPLNGVEVQVLSITHESVEIQRKGSPTSKRTLSIPDIINYESVSNASSQTPSRPSRRGSLDELEEI